PCRATRQPAVSGKGSRGCGTHTSSHGAIPSTLSVPNDEGHRKRRFAMPKRVMSLVAVALSLVFSSAAFAESPAAPVSAEAFLASLQAPEAPAPEVAELPALEGARTPDFKATFCGRYQCRPCSGGKVKTCWECIDGTTGCTGCGTACSI